MGKIIDFFLDRPLLVNLITVMIFIVGGFSAWTLQKEMFPKVEFDVILITTSYPGSSSEDVEKLVTLSLERELKAVDGIKEMNALSAEGSSIVYLTVEADADLEDVLDDVKNAVDAVDDLPDEAKLPRVRSLDNKTRGIIKVPLTGATYPVLRKHAKKIQDQLESLSPIARVELDGYRLDEIVIQINPDKLNEFEVTPSEIATSIKNRNLNLSAGKLETSTGDIIVRTISEFQNTQEIEDVVVRSNTNGVSVLVKDVASVVRRPLKGTTLLRSQGKEAVFLDIKAKENSDILKSVELVQDTIDNYFEKNSITGIEYRYTDDLSFYVKRRLNVLKNNGLVGIALVLGCLLLFLNFSTSIITSLGAPIAFFTSFIIMDATGLTINLISMFGLIIVLGMLVDDSIIVAEQYYQYLENGMKPKEAARKAALDTVKPVTATILTTIVAFGALFFMGGIMGKFLWMVPAMVIICLLASWIECFFILPSHLNDFVRLKHKKADSRWYAPIVNHYERTVRKFLKVPYITQFIFLSVFIVSILVGKGMRFELFPGDDVRVIYLQLKGKVGTQLKETNIAMKSLETMAMNDLKKDEYEQIKSTVGKLLGDHGTKLGTHYGSLVVYLTDPSDRDRSTDEILSELTKQAKDLVGRDFVVTTKKVQGGPPRGKPIDIELRGESIEELKVVSRKVEESLKSQEGVTSTEIDFEEGKQQVVITVNDQEARRLGVNTKAIAFELRTALAGDALSEIRENDEDIEIKILLDDTAKGQVESLSKIHILNNQGRRIPIAKVVDFKEIPGAFVIRRFDRKRIFSVSATLDNTLTSPRKASKAMKPLLLKILKDHPDVTFEFGGENKNTNESMERLIKSFVISVFCIFLILVVMFGSLGQPLVIMSAIPLGMIGVIFTFKLFGASLGFMAMLGVVGLVGVVVNDSIVLVTFINEKRTQISDINEAIVQGCRSRFRPVILTTFTTVAGLLPVAHAPGGDPFIKPMAMSFAWGLLFSTSVTLIFVPCSYLGYVKGLDYFKSLFLRKNDSSDESLAVK
ncbi:MAG: efflux RND transporter permease subunit [Bacteriovoracaceae bacterium]|nr:efflux RND transporter permease subunit [Bacteriovoracaceae bacterium]